MKLLKKVILLGCLFNLMSCAVEPAGNSNSSFEQLFETAKDGDVIDLSKNIVSISDEKVYEINKNITIKNGYLYNAKFVITAENVIFENVSSINEIVLEGEKYSWNNIHEGVHLKNVSVKKLVVNRKNVAVRMNDQTIVNNMELNYFCFLHADDEVSIKNVKNNTDKNNCEVFFSVSGRNMVQTLYSVNDIYGFMFYINDELVARGSPLYEYNYPATIEVARLLGQIEPNIFDGEIKIVDNVLYLVTKFNLFNSSEKYSIRLDDRYRKIVSDGQKVKYHRYVDQYSYIKPMYNCFVAKIVDKVCINNDSCLVKLQGNGEEFIFYLDRYSDFRVGDTITLSLAEGLSIDTRYIDSQDYYYGVLFDYETGHNLESYDRMTEYLNHDFEQVYAKYDY